MVAEVSNILAALGGCVPYTWDAPYTFETQ